MDIDSRIAHQHANAKKAYSAPRVQHLTPESAQSELKGQAESSDPQTQRMLSQIRELVGNDRKEDAG